MTDISKLPLDLYKANLELQLSLGKLLQEHGAQWLQRGQQLADESAAGMHAELGELLAAEDWQALATESASSFWRHMQRHIGDNQVLAQMLVEAQTQLAQGLQDAMRAWQQQTAQALAGLAPASAQDIAAWGNVFKPWAPPSRAGDPEVQEKKKPPRS
ncbi:MAG: hypothetical protein WCY98_07875 [Castellaniella sp.]